MFIYNDLNAELQRNNSMLELFINMQNFLQWLNDKKNIWWILTRRNKFYHEKKQINFKDFYKQFKIFYQQNFDQFNQRLDQYEFQNIQWKFVNFYRLTYQESVN
jgi:hypothetical protein